MAWGQCRSPKFSHNDHNDNFSILWKLPAFWLFLLYKTKCSASLQDVYVQYEVGLYIFKPTVPTICKLF